MNSYLHIVILHVLVKLSIFQSANSRTVQIEQVTGYTFSWTEYYDLPDIYACLNNTSKSYPTSSQLIVGGSSYEGRQILGLRINTIRGNVTKPAFFIESGIHAREWIAPATVTYFINQLLTSTDPQIISMRDQFDWHIFPVVNPDGYHFSFTNDRSWRKSRSQSPSGCRGVDLNRNWDTENWLVYSSSNDSCDYDIYAGTAPFSEPETRSLSQYLSKINNLQVHVAFHSDSKLLLVPYAGSMKQVKNYDDLIKIGKSSLAYGYRVNGTQYAGPGTAGEIAYMASGSSMDWVSKTLGVPLVFAYELPGAHFDWLPSRIPQLGDELTQMMLGLVVQANKLRYFHNNKSANKSL